MPQTDSNVMTLMSPAQFRAVYMPAATVSEVLRLCQKHELPAGLWRGKWLIDASRYARDEYVTTEWDAKAAARELFGACASD